MISIEEFKKIQLRVGEVETAERVEGSDKLLKLTVNFGEEEGRQVVSGIAKSYIPERLVGKQFLFVTNLESRMIMGLKSQAMILAAVKRKGEREEVVLMKPVKRVPPGASLS